MIEFVRLTTDSNPTVVFRYCYSRSLEYIVRYSKDSGELALYYNKGYGSYRYTRRAGWVSLAESKIDQDFFSWEEIYNIVAWDLL